MIFLERLKLLRRKDAVTDNCVYDELKRLRKIDNAFAETVSMYLKLAMSCGLSSQDIVDSCVDLAVTTRFGLEGDVIKKEQWQTSRHERLCVNRPPRVVQMQLYPLYFDAILKGSKTYEDRAFDPNSDKDYVDLREGDEIVFRVCRELDDWEDQCVGLGINANSLMKVKVGEVYFSPRVHGIFEYTPAVGREFQPQILDVASEIFELQKAAIYYTFPGYKEKISKYGFLGIQLKSPQIIQ